MIHPTTALNIIKALHNLKFSRYKNKDRLKWGLSKIISRNIYWNEDDKDQLIGLIPEYIQKAVH